MRNQAAVFVLSLFILAIFAATGDAAVCVLRSSSGTCKFWSGSVEAQLSANGAVAGDILSVIIHGERNDTDAGVFGVLFCGNGGSKSNVAPGVNAFADAFNNFTVLEQDDCAKNGICRDTIIAQADLIGSSLDETCKEELNSNWLAVDFVPCSDDPNVTDMFVTVQQIDELGVESTKLYACNLPIAMCEDLKWVRKSLKPERIQYDCTPA